MLVLFLLAVVPIMAISANHEVFFIIMSLLLMVMSVKNIRSIRSGNGGSQDDSEDELELDVEEMLDLDVKKFGTGVNIAKNLFIILFLVYCTVYLNSMVFKALSVIAVLLQLFFIFDTLKHQEEGHDQSLYKLQFMASNILNIAIIIFTVLNKVSGSKF